MSLAETLKGTDALHMGQAGSFSYFTVCVYTPSIPVYLQAKVEPLTLEIEATYASKSLCDFDADNRNIAKFCICSSSILWKLDAKSVLPAILQL